MDHQIQQAPHLGAEFMPLDSLAQAWLAHA
jgi:hypothetical protein